MAPPPFWIPPALTRDRIASLQSWLDERGFDACLVTGVENAAYLSGWRPDVEPWERPIALLVPRRGESALVLHELSVHGVRMARERGTLVVDDAVFYVERPAPGGASRADWGDLVATKLAALGVPAAARVACDALPGYLSEVAVAAPGVQLVADPSPLVEARAVKAPEELALMRGAARHRRRLRHPHRARAWDREHHHRVARRLLRRERAHPLRRRAVSRAAGSLCLHPRGAGEVYTIEPGIYLWGVGGFRVDDTVVVGEPPEVLTTTPRDLEGVTLPA